MYIYAAVFADRLQLLQVRTILQRCYRWKKPQLNYSIASIQENVISKRVLTKLTYRAGRHASYGGVVCKPFVPRYHSSDWLRQCLWDEAVTVSVPYCPKVLAFEKCTTRNIFSKLFARAHTHTNAWNEDIVCKGQIVISFCPLFDCWVGVWYFSPSKTWLAFF